MTTAFLSMESRCWLKLTLFFICCRSLMMLCGLTNISPFSCIILCGLLIKLCCYSIIVCCVLTLFRMGIFGAVAPYNDETWQSYTLPYADPKNIRITWHTPWLLLTSAFFHRKSANFVISRNTDIDCILVHNF